MGGPTSCTPQLVNQHQTAHTHVSVSFESLAAHCTVSMQRKTCAIALLDQIEGKLEPYHHTLTTVSMCQTGVAATLHCIHVLQCVVVQSCLQQCNVIRCRAVFL